MIMVTGATGHAGGATVAALQRVGAPVRAVSRSPRSWGSGVENVIGDLNEPDPLIPALAGVEAIFLISGYQGTESLLASAAAADVQRIVVLSSSSVPGGKMTNAVTRYHVLTEQQVKASGLAWTMLQPNTFMSNTFQWTAQLAAGDVVRGGFADVAVATIDPADIGEVAAKALLGGHEGQSHRLSGPESLRPADRLRILGEVLGRPLRYAGLSDAEARVEMTDTMPQEYIDAFFAFFADGDLDESEVRSTVQDVIGLPPQSYREWCEANAGDFVR